MTPKQLQTALIEWYHDHGRHDLPWQQPQTPYRVWVSEVMLQQTQVTTVMPYFERFMTTFPDVTHLADASLDDVLGLWSGLGYYSRGRNLHRASLLMVENHQAQVPTTLNELVALPGIGESTAGAILSLGHRQHGIICDGNVKRVLSRFYGITSIKNSTAHTKSTWQHASTLTPRQDSHHYNQAIMDLGASLCSRTKPQCDQCPWQNGCVAHQNGTMEQYPVRAPTKKAKVVLDMTHVALVKDDHVYLVKRHDQGIWNQLWCLPALDSIDIELSSPAKVDHLKHELTHRSLNIEIRTHHVPSMESHGDGQWYTLDHALTLGLPKPIRDWIVQHQSSCAIVA